MRLCRALSGDGMQLSAAREVEHSPAALSWACPTVGEWRSPGLVVVLGPEPLPWVADACLCSALSSPKVELSL